MRARDASSCQGGANAALCPNNSKLRLLNLTFIPYNAIREETAVAVQVFIGEKPEHPQERRAIVALANGLERLEGLYVIMSNFSVGGRNIDLVVMKPDGIFIIELKYCDGKIFGDVNGPWFVEGSNGERKRLNAGRKNPYNQVISYYYSLINFLNDQREGFVSSQKARAIDFRTCRRLVVIAPMIQEGSQVETDWKVDLKGLDELPAYLVTERSSEIDLSEEEMLRIPEMLHCTRWHEIDVLLAGPISPTAQGVARPETASPVATAAQPLTNTLAQEPVTTTPVTASGPWQQLATWRWRSLIVLSLVAALIVALVFALRPNGQAVSADQPAGALAASTSLPAGGIDPVPNSKASSCVWNGFQAVGRRYNTQSAIWEKVGVDVSAQSIHPDVVVTLETVSFCDGQISMTWSLRNNASTKHILPLSNDNIEIRDALGTRYTLLESASQPQVIAAEPGTRQSGEAIVAQPVNTNTPTLVIVLKKEPFGEATWMVTITQ